MNAKYLIIAVVSVGASRLVAQPLGANASKPETMLKVAEAKMAEKDYYNALDWYEKYYDKTKDKGMAFNIGELHYSLRDYVKAELWFQRAIDREKKTKKVEHPEALFYYGRVLKMNEKYEDAMAALEDYIAMSTDTVKLALAKNELLGAKMTYAMKENARLTVAPLGGKINTTNAEYSPSYSNGTLYFAAYRNTGPIVLNGKEGDYHSKVYQSKKLEGGAWSDA